MAKVERGVHVVGPEGTPMLRITLTLQSEDGTTHSAMGNQDALFGTWADAVSDFAREQLRRLMRGAPAETRSVQDSGA